MATFYGPRYIFIRLCIDCLALFSVFAICQHNWNCTFDDVVKIQHRHICIGLSRYIAITTKWPIVHYSGFCRMSQVHPNFENKKNFFPENNFLASTTTRKIHWIHWWNPFFKSVQWPPCLLFPIRHNAASTTRRVRWYFELGNTCPVHLFLVINVIVSVVCCALQYNKCSTITFTDHHFFTGTKISLITFWIVPMMWYLVRVSSQYLAGYCACIAIMQICVGKDGGCSGEGKPCKFLVGTFYQWTKTAAPKQCTAAWLSCSWRLLSSCTSVQG